MILTCPDCATRYFVDDAKLGAEGRTVRCSGCGVTWKAKAELALELVATAEEGALAKAPAAAPPPEEPAKPEPLPKVFRAKQVEKRTLRQAMVHGVVWAGMAAVVAGLLATAALFRVDVVRLIPRAAGAYAMVGLPVNPTGLIFEKISAKPALQNGHSALVVSGQIRNVEDRQAPVPPIRIHILDSHGKPVKTAIAPAEHPHIKPGETHHFVITLLDPPATAHDVEVAFALEKAKHAPVAKAGRAAPAGHHEPGPPVLRGSEAPSVHIEPEVHVEEAVPLPMPAPQTPGHATTAEDHH